MYANPGLYDVKLTASNFSSSNVHIITGLIKVYQNPVAELSASSSTSGCLPLVVDFQDLSITNSAIVAWQWDFGDGSTSTTQNPDHQFNGVSVFDIALKIENTSTSQNWKLGTFRLDIQPDGRR